MPKPTVTPERLEKYKWQLYQAGAIGGLEGSLVGLFSGLYILRTYNHGRNVKAFSLPIKVLYLSSWCVAGIVFSTNIEKSKIVKQMLVEHEIKREQFLNNEFNRDPEVKGK